MRKQTIDETRRCPKCGRAENQINAGYNRSGTRRCLCKICNYKYTPDGKTQGFPQHGALFHEHFSGGSSFDDYSQETVNLIFSHVNSVRRKSLGGKSPFEVFAFLFDHDATAVLGIRPIPPAEVIQSPKLLR